MATHTLSLLDGWTLGEQTHQQITLRPATAGDVLASSKAAERLMQGSEGEWRLVASPTEAAAQLLCRQIERVGSEALAVVPAMLERLSARDFALLQEGASALLEADAANRLGESSGKTGA